MSFEVKVEEKIESFLYTFIKFGQGVYEMTFRADILAMVAILFNGLERFQRFLLRTNKF